MLHIVLYEPEIPQNTGNIMRTCAALGATLHLIEPFGFILDEQKVRRSAMDYRSHLTLLRHEDWAAFLQGLRGEVFFLSRYGQKTHSDFDFASLKDQEVYLVFGKESTGIPKTILKESFDHCFRLPMKEDARSLNLSNTVAVVAYEVMRQWDYPDLVRHEVLKGKDFIFE